MTVNEKQITKLKNEQKKKKKQIEASKKKMFKNLLWLIVILFGISMLHLENGHKGFGSPKSFLTFVVLVLALISAGYYVVIKFQNEQKEKEIKIIKGKLYRLMKLDND